MTSGLPRMPSLTVDATLPAARSASQSPHSPVTLSPGGSVVSALRNRPHHFRDDSDTDCEDEEGSTFDLSEEFPGEAPDMGPGHMRTPTTVKGIELTLVGLNGLQKQKKLADYSIQDDLDDLNTQLASISYDSFGDSFSDDNTAPVQRPSALKPLKKKNDEQSKMDLLLAESITMSNNVDALLSKLSSQRNAVPTVGGGNSRMHRRQLSRSLPNLRAATNAVTTTRHMRKTRHRRLHQPSPIMEGKSSEETKVNAVDVATLARSVSFNDNATSTGPARRQTRSKTRTLPKSRSMGNKAQFRASTPALAKAGQNFANSLRGGPKGARQNGEAQQKQLRDLRYGVCSLVGADSAESAGRSGAGRHKKQNQDTHLVVEDYPEPGAAVFAVFDGHGRAGQRCSKFCADNFVAVLQKAKFQVGSAASLTNNVTTAIKRAFTSLQRMLHHASFDTEYSGTTVTAAVLVPRLGKLVTINCGDSNCCLGSLFGGECERGTLGPSSIKRAGAISPPPLRTCNSQTTEVNGKEEHGNEDDEVDVVEDPAELEAMMLSAALQQRGKALQQQQQQQQQQQASKPRSSSDSDVASPAATTTSTSRNYNNNATKQKAKQLVLPKFRIKFLHKSHSPTGPKERARVEAAGGYVFKLPGDTERVWKCGPEEALDEGDSGLAMSRSLGDEDLHRVGVSSEPAVRVQDLRWPRDQFLVLGSDGVWDHANEFDVISVVRDAQKKLLQGAATTTTTTTTQQTRLQPRQSKQRKRSAGTDSNQSACSTDNGVDENGNCKDTSRQGTRWNAVGAASALCQLARTRWKRRKGRVDDVTAIVVNLAMFLP